MRFFRQAVKHPTFDECDRARHDLQPDGADQQHQATTERVGEIDARAAYCVRRAAVRDQVGGERQELVEDNESEQVAGQSKPTVAETHRLKKPKKDCGAVSARDSRWRTVS